MRTKKVLLAGGLFFLAVFFSGCADENSDADKSGASGGSGIGLLDVNKKAQEDITKATEQENARLNNNLNENKN